MTDAPTPSDLRAELERLIVSDLLGPSSEKASEREAVETGRWIPKCIWSA